MGSLFLFHLDSDLIKSKHHFNSSLFLTLWSCFAFSIICSLVTIKIMSLQPSILNFHLKNRVTAYIPEAWYHVHNRYKIHFKSNWKWFLNLYITISKLLQGQYLLKWSCPLRTFEVLLDIYLHPSVKHHSIL